MYTYVFIIMIMVLNYWYREQAALHAPRSLARRLSAKPAPDGSHQRVDAQNVNSNRTQACTRQNR